MMGNVKSNNMAGLAEWLCQFLATNGIVNMAAELMRKIKMEFSEVKRDSIL